jgi:hypothetical protein
MNLKFIVFVILTGLLISCKDTLKPKTKSVNSDTIEPKTTNIESEIADTSKAFTALYLIKSKETPVTDKLRECIKEKIESAETIDFTGHHTQGSGGLDSKNDQWLTLQEIVKQTKR